MLFSSTFKFVITLYINIDTALSLLLFHIVSNLILNITMAIGILLFLFKKKYLFMGRIKRDNELLFILLKIKQIFSFRKK